ncbi:uncharacterized protein LOC141829111 [Curcuma longa]|uniref:uncharacterized protein LOC141829111 n=1 Tax=Curcuma longa TaxID=136217 RepID=UPI003D9F4CB3
MKMQETQIAQISSSLSSRQVGALPGKPDFNPMEHCKAIELRSGWTLKGKEPQVTAPLEGITCTSTVKQLPSSTLIVEDELEEVKTATPDEEPPKKTLVRNIPFPQRLIVKDITLDIPLIDTLVEMPKFAKFIKGLMSTKNITEAKHTVALMEEVSAIILNNKLSPKLKDPRSFTIPCKIGMISIGRAFCNIGARVSIIPYATSEKYGYTDLKLTTMAIQLADHSCRYPMGIVEDVTVEVGRFTVPTDFIVLDIEEDSSIPIILGRSFLATIGAKIDVKKSQVVPRSGKKKGIARKCYIGMVQTDLCEVQRKQKAKVHSVQDAPLSRPTQEKMEVQIIPGQPNRVTQVATNLPPKLKGRLTTCLTRNHDVFTWPPLEIAGVAPTVMEHQLNLLPGSRPV